MCLARRWKILDNKNATVPCTMELNPFWTRITILMQPRFHDTFQFKITKIGITLTLAKFSFSFAVNFDKMKISVVFFSGNCQNTYYTVWPEPIWIKVKTWWQILPQHQSTYLWGLESASTKIPPFRPNLLSKSTSKCERCEIRFTL